MEVKPQIPIKTPKVKKPNAGSFIKRFLSRYSSVILYAIIAGSIACALLFIFGGDKQSIRDHLVLQVLILGFGILHIFIAPKIFEWCIPFHSKSSVLFTTVLGFAIAGVFVLSTLVSVLQRLPQTYVWTAILFVLPWLFMIGYEVWVDIPAKDFKKWIYPYQQEIPVVEVIEPAKVTFLISKQINDDEYYQFDLNVPLSYKLGDFIHYFIHRYNYDKNPASPIYFSKENDRVELYEWLFKRKPKSTANSNILDPEKTFKELKVRSGDKVIAERTGIREITAETDDVFIVDKNDEDEKD